MKYIKLYELFETIGDELKTKLLSIGGNSIKETYEEDLYKLLNRGKLFQPDDIECLGMEQSRCHQNSAHIWKKADHLNIVSGWALNKNIWYQHTWLYRPESNEIIETVGNPYEEYFGFILNKEESIKFYWDNN